MSRSKLKTISDTDLANTVLDMKQDYGYWDQDPAVFRFTRNDFNKLGAKMAKGVGEILKRVNDDGLQAHMPLKRIFDAASKLPVAERKEADAIYEALRNVHRKKENKPRYAF